MSVETNNSTTSTIAIIPPPKKKTTTSSPSAKSVPTDHTDTDTTLIGYCNIILYQSHNKIERAVSGWIHCSVKHFFFR